MRLLLVRHAAAVRRGALGVPDHDRPLTVRGKAKFGVAAAGLARIAGRPDVLLTSARLRARGTAEIAARAFKDIQPTIEPALARGKVDDVIAALAVHPADTVVALVGHEPLLRALLARLLGASDGTHLAFRKGGAALLDLPSGPAVAGRLVWFIPPRVLRTLAGDDGLTA